MFTSLAVGSALVSSSLAALLPATPVVDAVITPGPNIELLRKQNDIRYMGYISYTDGWTSEICDIGNTYYQGGGQWACCTTTKAGCQNLPVACLNGDLIYRATSTSGSGFISGSLITRACSSIYTASTDRSFSLCNTAFMFENDRDSNPNVNIVCGVSSANWSYYRQAPSAATAISSRSASATPSPNRASPTPGASSTPSSLPTTLSSGVDTDTSSSSSKKSKAWIAGAVIGPLVGLALIGAAAFFLIRKKKNKAQDQQFVPATGSMPPAPGPAGVGGHTAYQANQAAQPPQYYPNNAPQMQQTQPMGMPVKQDGYYGAPPQGAQSPVSPYNGTGAQQWQQQPQQGGQPVYNNVPSPSMSPAPQQMAAPAPYHAEARPFSSELEGSGMQGHGTPELVSVQPKR